jgi:hypothetical protein
VSGGGAKAQDYNRLPFYIPIVVIFSACDPAIANCRRRRNKIQKKTANKRQEREKIMSMNFNELNEDTLRRTAECSSISIVGKNEEADHSEESDTVKSKLEELYERPLRRLDEEEKADLVNLVSAIIDGSGEIELKRLILEDRLPVIVEDDDWYTESYPNPLDCLLYRLLSDTRDFMADYQNSSDAPIYYLRLFLAIAVLNQLTQLTQLRQQLGKHGESSAVIERKIDSLSQLNTLVPLSPKEFSETVN